MISTTPLFVALTRPVSIAGLPMTYVVMLVILVVGGFIATLSIAWLLGSAAIGYAALRLLAGYDPRFFDVILTTLQKTPLPARWIQGKGISYSA